MATRVKRSLKPKVTVIVARDITFKVPSQKLKDPEPEISIFHDLGIYLSRRNKRAIQVKLLKLLFPSFFEAYTQGQTQAVFKCAYQVWFLRFPDPEHQIVVKADYSEDPEYTDFICKQREKWLRSLVCWLAFRFPAMVDGPVPANPTWVVLMNVAIQEIMRTLEVPQDRSDCEEALKEIEKMVQDSLVCTRAAGNPEVEIFCAPLKPDDKASLPTLHFLMRGKHKTQTFVVLRDDSDDEMLIPHARSFYEVTPVSDVAGKVAAKCYPTSDAPLLDWAGQLQGFMSCTSADGLYRCEDCLGGTRVSYLLPSVAPLPATSHHPGTTCTFVG
ncbi:uncharacterized protein LACBIDRAFT_307781 [Laccaria bicolor S238N-H82]|uniref:Predicted protein n=1 Tax=Laccaria bicolor (strain S238N-H82 / ATCC MYA-4686) TaxID=486041 RepID=B0DR08_LACBS|nr:uncharacterized protein LACBIDRAFT_307781 [Laccaria bicolor S238N-H82]EDR02980.1 predicted protein [Laccaria bicolor S238N-H82]|eukprot:XP_001886403.1 predicted protein [Laccaria bicolor S238N-H82]